MKVRLSEIELVTNNDLSVTIEDKTVTVKSGSKLDSKRVESTEHTIS